MIKCPKCGFEQPKDRFCAKCGIVMENFSPNNGVVPMGYKLPTFLVILVLIFFCGGMYWLYHRAPSPEQETPTGVTQPIAPPITQKKALVKTDSQPLGKSNFAAGLLDSNNLTQPVAEATVAAAPSGDS